MSFKNVTINKVGREKNSLSLDSVFMFSAGKQNFITFCDSLCKRKVCFSFTKYRM